MCASYQRERAITGRETFSPHMQMKTLSTFVVRFSVVYPNTLSCPPRQEAVQPDSLAVRVAM